jgi:hypothetical protein
MLEFWDDKAVRVQRDTGELLTLSGRGLLLFDSAGDGHDPVAPREFYAESLQQAIGVANKAIDALKAAGFALARANTHDADQKKMEKFLRASDIISQVLNDIGVVRSEQKSPRQLWEHRCYCGDPKCIYYRRGPYVPEGEY